MDAFDLSFESLPQCLWAALPSAPPRLRLVGPEHGWIDLVVGEEGGEFAPVTLSQVYPPLADQAAGPDDDDGIAHYRHPERQRLTHEAMAEWDAWLQNPDPDHTPEAVWRRWKRWRDEQGAQGGHGDA